MDGPGNFQVMGGLALESSGSWRWKIQVDGSAGVRKFGWAWTISWLMDIRGKSLTRER